MTVDSTATDREVWQVMSGAGEPRFDANLSAAAGDPQSAANSGPIHHSASWADAPVDAHWNTAAVAGGAATTGSRAWGQGTLETDDASLFGADCSLSSMMRSIASEAISTERSSYPWSNATAPKPAAAVGTPQETGNRWSGIAGSSASGNSSTFGPFATDGWGCIVGAAPVDPSKAMSAGWDADKQPEPNSEASQGVAGEKPDGDVAGKWPSVAKSDSAADMHLRSSEHSATAADAATSSATVTSASSSAAADNRALIDKLINCNEGWGKRPVRQDIPWVMEDSFPESAAAAAPAVEPPENLNKDILRNTVSVGAVPEIASSAAGLYWGETPRHAAASSIEFGADGDIGMWNGPPEAAGAGQLLGMQKDASGWHGLAALGGGTTNPPGVLSGPPPPLGSLGLASHLLETSSFPGVPASFIDVMQRELASGKDAGADGAWSQVLGARQNSSIDPSLVGSASGPLESSSMWRSPTKGQASPPSSLQKISSWNEQPGSASGMPGQGFWNQPPPVMSGFSGNFQHIPGNKKEDMMQFMQQPQRGRMLRGQSTGDVLPGAGPMFADPSMHASGRPSAFQPVFNSAVPPPLHRNPSLGGSGWPSGGTGFAPYGSATPPHMNPASLHHLLELQAILQPLLNERSVVQQSRTLNPLQRRQALDRLNPMIDAIKRQMDQLQVASAGMHPSDLPPNFDVAAAQLLGRLKLDQDPNLAAAAAMPLGPGGDFGLRGGGGLGVGSPDVFGGSGWVGGSGAGASGGSQFGWPEPAEVGAFGRGLRGPTPMPGVGQPPQSFGGNSGVRSSLWSPPFATPGGKVDQAGGKNSAGQIWLKLSNISPQLDSTLVQMLCSQCGPLTAFFFNKTASQALVCFTNLDDAQRASKTFGATGTGMSGDIVTLESVCQLIEGPTSSNWVSSAALPFGAQQLPAFGKP